MSLVPFDNGLSVMCNRDERHTRASALPPVTRRFDDREAMLPLDAERGGTWIAVNDAGLVMTVLNRQTCGPPRAGLESRGLIIPSLLRSAGIDDVLNAAGRIVASAYPPFTLVAATRTEVAAVTSDGLALSFSRRPIILPAMFTSSSINEGLALALRGRLFRRMVVSARERVASQPMFHAHQWTDCSALSVRMWRPDARTVSQTQIRIERSNVSLEYSECSPIQ